VYTNEKTVGMKKKNQGLKQKILFTTLTVLALMAAIVIGLAYKTITDSMHEQTRDYMEKQCKLFLSILDNHYPGEYGIGQDTSGAYFLVKGEEVISDEYDNLDRICKVLDVELSVFGRDMRLMTTICDENGERVIGTIASPVVIRDVLDGATPTFYTDAEISGIERFVYYEPIFTQNGEVIGMIGVSRPTESVREDVNKALMPIAFMFVIAITFIGIIVVAYAERTIKKIQMIERFMDKVASGNFGDDLQGEVIRQNDELGQLARNSVSMQKSLRTLVEQDALTGLNNRRYANNRLQQVYNRLQEKGVGYSICLCDIDFFKKVNDTYGHDNGDEVLKAVAKVLKKNMLGNGFAARWGGEEFLLVFEGKTLSASLGVLENALHDIRELEIPAKEHIIKVTMTFGIVEATEQDDIDQILMRADEKLYYGKASGRNQIVW